MFFSLHDLDKKMLKYINYENGVFIEAGANDGLTQSNTAYFEKNLNWTGLLVEPNKHFYNNCKKNRTNSIVENYALVSNNYNKQYINGNFNDTVSNGLMCMVTDDCEHYDEHIENHKKEKKNRVEVKTATLTSLLEKNNITKIDFFSLDVEGYEISVLNGLDFIKYRPKYILIETENRLNYQIVVRDYMIEKNYKFLERLSLNDDLFIDNSI
jgi:FkbM family methyltransferase